MVIAKAGKKYDMNDRLSRKIKQEAKYDIILLTGQFGEDRECKKFT